MLKLSKYYYMLSDQRMIGPPPPPPPPPIGMSVLSNWSDRISCHRLGCSDENGLRRAVERADRATYSLWLFRVFFFANVGGFLCLIASFQQAVIYKGHGIEM